MKSILIFALFVFASLNGAQAQERKTNAMITQGDVFPVEVEREDESEDGKSVIKTKDIEFWAIRIYPEINSGELFIITQTAVPGQRYPIVNRYPLQNIQDLGGGKFFATALQDGALTATNPRKLIIEMASPIFIASVTGTLKAKSVMSGRSIEKTFRNITEKNLQIYVDKPQ